jgi:hypothetical protein
MRPRVRTMSVFNDPQDSIARGVIGSRKERTRPIRIM